jgi:hypothetical protein
LGEQEPVGLMGENGLPLIWFALLSAAWVVAAWFWQQLPVKHRWRDVALAGVLTYAVLLIWILQGPADSPRSWLEFARAGWGLGLLGCAAALSAARTLPSQQLAALGVTVGLSLWAAVIGWPEVAVIWLLLNVIVIRTGFATPATSANAVLARGDAWLPLVTVLVGLLCSLPLTPWLSESLRLRSSATMTAASEGSPAELSLAVLPILVTLVAMLLWSVRSPIPTGRNGFPVHQRHSSTSPSQRPSTEMAISPGKHGLDGPPTSTPGSSAV